MLATLPATAQQKPNVVFILADNVGYGDLGSYGGGELRGAPTPRLDQLDHEGLRFTQFLVEPACTPSRAALMTGQYSIRNGLSLIAVEGSTNTLSARAFTMGDMFKSVGYATAIFGKWHLGGAPQSLPTAHGFDEFYGIPPDISWDAATYPATIALTHSSNEPYETLLKTGPQIVQATAGGPLQTVKPFTEDVRANIDNELVDKSIDFMRREKAAGKPFFLYLPFSMGHFPNLPSQQFKGKSRIGNYGDKLMEGDFHVGQILDTLKELGVDDNTIVVFASDNGPQGETAREHGNQGTPDMGNSGPFRGELAQISHTTECIGVANQRKPLCRNNSSSIRGAPPMPTECSPDFFGFEPVEGRAVVAAFDAGAVTSDAGALLLGSRDQDDGSIGLVLSRRAVPGAH
jgi:arylsulfatase